MKNAIAFLWLQRKSAIQCVSITYNVNLLLKYIKVTHSEIENTNYNYDKDITQLCQSYNNQLR